MVADNTSSLVRDILDSVRHGYTKQLEDYIRLGYRHEVLSARDSSNRTACHEAARNGHVDILNVLHREGANFNAPSLRGLTPAHQAAFTGEYAFIARLVKLGYRVDLKDENGFTPLDAALEAGHYKIIALLESLYATIPASKSISSLEYEMLEARRREAAAAESNTAAAIAFASATTDNTRIPHKKAPKQRKSRKRIPKHTSLPHTGISTTGTPVVPPPRLDLARSVQSSSSVWGLSPIPTPIGRNTAEVSYIAPHEKLHATKRSRKRSVEEVYQPWEELESIVPGVDDVKEATADQRRSLLSLLQAAEVELSPEMQQIHSDFTAEPAVVDLETFFV